MEFQVPQYIEVEDKIFGPLTFKQFIYLAGGAGLCFIIYVLIGPIWMPLAYILMAPVALLAAALAFYPVNGRPFVTILEAAFKFGTSSKLYLWQQHQDQPIESQPTPEKSEPAPVAIPALTETKLKDLSWSLDIKNDTSNDQSNNLN